MEAKPINPGVVYAEVNVECIYSQIRNPVWTAYEAFTPGTDPDLDHLQKDHDLLLLSVVDHLQVVPHLPL